MSHSVVALFRTHEEAEQAVENLVLHGIDRSDVSIITAKSVATSTFVEGVAGGLGTSWLGRAGGGPVIPSCGGLVSAFLGAGLAPDEAKYYARGVEEGGVAVAVRGEAIARMADL